MNNLELIISKLDLKKSVLDPINLEILKPLPLYVREEIALQTKMMVLYHGQEVESVRLAEESAATKALPDANFKHLNVVNVGAGNRLINPSFIAIDAFRNVSEYTGTHAETNSVSILSKLDDLPFKSESVDAILSLHSLEHIEDPVNTVLAWGDMLKPGGGIGIILPDYRYTYSARNDQSSFGHKWDPTPEVLLSWYEKYWSKFFILEKINTYQYKISFDVILRKPGVHKSFDKVLSEQVPRSGYKLCSMGAFPNDIY